MLVLPPPLNEEKQLNSSSVLKDVFDRQPAELVDVALSRLQAAGVKLIEWRALLYRRMGRPIILRNFSYVVPDEAIPRASDILRNIGLPLSPHSKLLTRVEGDIHTKAIHYRLTRSSAPAWVQHLVLYPTSFVSLNPEELYSAPSIYLPSAAKILVPRPSAVYAWILRTMLNYPRLCRVRTILASDLSELVDYHLFRVKEGYVTPDENPELWKELDMEGRKVDALKVIKQWTRNHEWREGEEWFGDALEAIVSEGGDIDYLPYCNSVS